MGASAREAAEMGVMGEESEAVGEIVRLLTRQCGLTAAAAIEIETMVFGAMLPAARILELCGMHELERNRFASTLKRGRIVAAVKGVIKNARRSPKFKCNMPALLWNWLARHSKRDDFTDEGWQLHQLWLMQKKRRFQR